MATKTIPVNNYNDSDNYGTSGEAPSLYSDKHYLDGDGFLYGLGMASQRMIVKGKNDDIVSPLSWVLDGGETDKTKTKLSINKSSLIDNIKGPGLSNIEGLVLGVNVDQGLYIGTNNQHSATYNKININFFKKNVTINGTASLYNVSGLELVTGTADTTGAPAAGQLRIKLSETGSGTSYINTSGLMLKDPGNVGNLHITEGLMVNYDNVTIGLNESNQLEVKASAIVPNISGTNPIEVTTSGNTKAIGLKLANTVESGTQRYDSGLDVNSYGLYVKIDSTVLNNPLFLGNSGLWFDWLNFPIGDGLTFGGPDASHPNIGVDIDSTAGLAFTNDGSLVINLSTSTGNNPLSFNSADGGLDLIFDDSLRGDGSYGMASGKTGLGVSLYRSANGTNLSGIEFVSGDSTHDPGLKIKLGNNSNLSVNSNGISVTTASSITSTDTKPATSKAVYNAIAAAVADLEAADFEFVIAATLPTASAAYKQKIYLIPLSGASTPDTYEEYVCINTGSTASPSYQWEKIGDTSFTTDNFVAKTDVLTQAEVASIVQDVFGF